ncbi:hypothetical protein ALC56_09543 [Trachymyrmex septentrionalis]|uniref:Uncharacterized protein n=1 Tax=Trachymyrmex septentrionalis TaxID=34720 RepID=A0A195F699_9HYME|nr:hypothetical protein ALC56_09543 [Trachymyrmex septentrionalis]
MKVEGIVDDGRREHYRLERIC